MSDIGGMLMHSVLKSNQIAQHVIAEAAGIKKPPVRIAKPKANGG